MMLNKILLTCSAFLYASIPPSSAFQSHLLKEHPIIASPDSTRWAYENNLDAKHGLTSTLFQQVALYLRSHTESNGSRASCLPFLMRRNINSPMMIEFNCHDLESAVESDYLSAGGWQSTADLGEDEHAQTDNVHSFQAQRLHWKSVLNTPNTIIFNSAGAYISSILSATSLAALHGLDGAAVGIALNLYVTPANVRTSAPPHTDKQDVVVVQTQGRKRWRVYSPPDSSIKSELDPFTRGKGADSITLDMLEGEGSQSKLLLDVTLLPGDILFIPARFPHTTDTLDCYGDDEDHDETLLGETDWSMHLTIGLDSHVWAMNYISMRTLALRTHGMHDVLQETNGVVDRSMDRCVGRVNELSNDLREGLYSSVDDTMFSFNSMNDLSDQQSLKPSMGKLASNLLSFHDRTNLECGWVDEIDHSLTLDQCLETVNQFRNVGQKIADAHRDMYVAAVKEEQTRIDEQGGWALNVGDSMLEERAKRLSIFRVAIYFQKLDAMREELRAWGDTSRHAEIAIELLIGDQVESVYPTNRSRGIDQSSWSSAKVVKVRTDDGLFDLQFFDGTVQKGVERNNITGPHGIGIFI
ncbi:hypothetical protein ACHAXR_011708 [Thalassiosira sp. AJA248-18]